MDDTAWSSVARPCSGFRLDVGFEAPEHVPGWLLPAGARHPPRIEPVGLPTTQGHVLSADVVGREQLLIRYFADLLRAAGPKSTPGNPIAPFSCMGVNVLLLPDGEASVALDMFGAAQAGSDMLLAHLADPAAAAGVAYDNLDQGWARRVLIGPAEVIVLDWDDADAQDEPRQVQAYRLSRPEVARLADAARRRLAPMHTQLVSCVGRDLWNVPHRR